MSFYHQIILVFAILLGGLGWCNWGSASSSMLRAAEKKILSYLKTPYKGWYVDVGSVVGQDDKIWTISLNTESPKTPLLLIPGFAAGVALWAHNLDSFAENRPVYAIDCLGFGQSSRPKFSKDALLAEKQFVNSVEEWRKEMKIDKMIILGHSFGGFLAASYALSYPDRVKQLILADPWGFTEKPANNDTMRKIPLWVRAIAVVVKPLNPLWALRAAGPYGQWVVEKTRPDITRKFSSIVKDDDTVIAQYIHQCNAQTPSGESAFHSMMYGFGWAKHPMLSRMHEMRSDIPISLLYGSLSWIDRAPGETIKSSRTESFVNIQIIDGAGHHVYADVPEIFNRYVNEACSLTDSSVQPVAFIKNKNGEATQLDPQQDDEVVPNLRALTNPGDLSIIN